MFVRCVDEVISSIVSEGARTFGTIDVAKPGKYKGAEATERQYGAIVRFRSRSGERKCLTMTRATPGLFLGGPGPVLFSR